MIQKWTISSIAKHLSEKVPNVHLHVDGDEDQTADKKEWIELYVQGPNIRPGHETSMMYVDIYVGCLVHLNNNTYSLAFLQDKVFKALNQPIKIFQTPDQPKDGPMDEVGCLKLRSDQMHSLDIVNFGVVSDKTIRLRRGTVEGHYEIVLDNSSLKEPA